MKKKNVVIGTIGAAAAASATYLAAGRIAIEKVCTRRKEEKVGLKHPMSEDDKQWLDHQTFIDMEITSYDGLKLEGQFLPYPDSNKLVIMDSILTIIVSLHIIFVSIMNLVIISFFQIIEHMDSQKDIILVLDGWTV